MTNQLCPCVCWLTSEPQQHLYSYQPLVGVMITNILCKLLNENLLIFKARRLGTLIKQKVIGALQSWFLARVKLTGGHLSAFSIQLQWTPLEYYLIKLSNLDSVHFLEYPIHLLVLLPGKVFSSSLFTLYSVCTAPLGWQLKWAGAHLVLLTHNLRFAASEEVNRRALAYCDCTHWHLLCSSFEVKSAASTHQQNYIEFPFNDVMNRFSWSRE